MNPKPSRKIIPLNLPAGVDEQVAGNPVITRLETVPANCFPGLDVDVRNLDRRFFPGLLFNFNDVEEGDPLLLTRGALLVEVDLSDPDLDPKQDADLIKQLSQLSLLLSQAVIVLNSVTLQDGTQIPLTDDKKVPFNWRAAWRIVRSLPPGQLTIELSRFDGQQRVFLINLKGRRRTYQKPTGELSGAYRPGELTQSLCSPWQHDFRDCSCTYWATNHPDIVLAAHPSDLAEFDDEGPDQDRAEDPVIWMRWDRTKRVPPRPTGDGCRPLELDHYEINDRWKELNFVLEGREQLTPWLSVAPSPSQMPSQDPLKELRTLAGMEQALALEYLYARYTVRFWDSRIQGEEHRHATFIAHELLNVAIGEMMHLRWANELLRALQRLKKEKITPALRVGKLVPVATFAGEHPIIRQPNYEAQDRPAQERPLNEAISDFVAAELPSGTLQGKYAGILALLEEGWPKPRDRKPDLIELVERIAADGVEHYARFREIQAQVAAPDGHKLVRKLSKLRLGSRQCNVAERLYSNVIDGLLAAYGPAGSRKGADDAHQAMLELDQFATKMAKAGRAVPFLGIANRVANRMKLP